MEAENTVDENEEKKNYGVDTCMSLWFFNFINYDQSENILD